MINESKCKLSEKRDEAPRQNKRCPAMIFPMIIGSYLHHLFKSKHHTNCARNSLHKLPLRSKHVFCSPLHSARKNHSKWRSLEASNMEKECPRFNETGCCRRSSILTQMTHVSIEHRLTHWERISMALLYDPLHKSPTRWGSLDQSPNALVSKSVTKGGRDLISLPEQNRLVSQCRAKERALAFSHEHHFEFSKSLPPHMVFRSDNGCNAQSFLGKLATERRSLSFSRSRWRCQWHIAANLRELQGLRFLEPKHFGSHAAFPWKSQSTSPFLPCQKPLHSSWALIEVRGQEL